MNSNLWWGLLITCLGVLLLLHNLRILHFGEALHTYWPAVLIVWGLGIILGKRK
jgi:hypothetical protein